MVKMLHFRFFFCYPKNLLFFKFYSTLKKNTKFSFFSLIHIYFNIIFRSLAYLFPEYLLSCLCFLYPAINNDHTVCNICTSIYLYGLCVFFVIVFFFATKTFFHCLFHSYSFVRFVGIDIYRNNVKFL